MAGYVSARRPANPHRGPLLSQRRRVVVESYSFNRVAAGPITRSWLANSDQPAQIGSLSGPSREICSALTSAGAAPRAIAAQPSLLASSPTQESVVGYRRRSMEHGSEGRSGAGQRCRARY
jgi:hypothetical protein